MDLHSRRELMESISKRYGQASKASKTRILDEICAATRLNRKYAITRIKLIETRRPAPLSSRRNGLDSEPRTPLDRLAAMPGADRQKAQALLHLRSRLDPINLSRNIQKKLARIWAIRQIGKRRLKKKSSRIGEVERLGESPAVPGLAFDWAVMTVVSQAGL